MKTLIIAVLALASIARAEVVFMSDHGKTYHTNRKCMSLSRATRVLSADDKEALAHGLTLCGICKRSKGGTTKKAGNGAWAK